MEPPAPPAPQAQQPNGLEFTSDWFGEVKVNFEDFARSNSGKKLRVLEIGSYEGRSATWILDNLLDHPESHLTAIDTFAGGMEHRNDDHDVRGLERRFLSNVAQCKHVDRLRVMKKDSDEALLQLRREKAVFDFIYIDGSHIAVDVLYDAELCWRMLEIYSPVLQISFLFMLSTASYSSLDISPALHFSAHSRSAGVFLANPGKAANQ
ncbi:hypothetical protein MMC10_004781 [Thelotrema lepadinum]|nr:hypothetical protein [Thelotrema lepadinum]